MSEKLSPETVGGTSSTQGQAVEGRDADRGLHVDALIDEALRDLAGGAPRDGFRGRVMARIAALPKPSRAALIEIWGWHLRPWRLAMAGAVVALGLTVAGALSLILRPGELRPAGPASVGTQSAALARPAEESARQSVATNRTQPQASQAQLRRSASHSRVETTRGGAGDEDSSSIPSVAVAPLPDPDPITNAAIDIRPVQIQELTIPGIEVQPLDAGRAMQNDK